MNNRTENGSLLFFSAGQEDCQSLLCRQDTVTIVHVQQDIWPGRGGSASPANAPGLATLIDKQAVWKNDWTGGTQLYSLISQQTGQLALSFVISLDS